MFYTYGDKRVVEEMKYFKNTELAKLYNVSEKSVRNWIDAAQAGKLDLQLYTVNERDYIANTTKNGLLVTELADRGKKYKNSRGVKKLHPKKAFYELYNERQIIDIISHLTIYHESPLQYTYVDGGADDWNKYASRLLNEQAPNMLKRSIELIEMTAPAIDRLLEKYEKINVIDLGPGNGLPLKPTLRRLLKDGRLGKYIPVDISNDMLAIVERNIKTWFGDAVTVDARNYDISYERFNDLLANNFTDTSTANIVFLLGGTLANFRSPEQVLQTVKSSMGPNDLFVYTGYLDTPKTRRYFDYYTSDRKVPVQDGLILDLLSIDESLYDVEQKFDDQKRARSISIRPTVDLSIIFDINGGSHPIELRKGESILIWRHWHKSMVEMVNLFDRNDFDVMQAVKPTDGQHALIISRIKTIEN